jgi:hypothetical protein
MDTNSFSKLAATNGLTRGYPRRRKSYRGRLVLTVVLLVVALDVIGSPWFDLQFTKVLGLVDKVVDMVLLQAQWLT